MIIYFANRDMEILGQAATRLPKGLIVSNDKKTSEVEHGTKVFEFEIDYTDRAEAEAMTQPGNYILRADGEEKEFYTIIDSDVDVTGRVITMYAEDAGLDLLNEVVGDYTASSAMTIASYVSAFIGDSGFEIGINEVSNLSRQLEWTGESTVTERLQSLAAQFGAELSFSFEIDQLTVVHKYINFWKPRGNDTGVILRIGQHIKNLRVKRSVANLATALLVQGGTPSGSSSPITLQGYSYDDGDIYIDGQYLKSRTALTKWARGGSGDIVKRWSYDTTQQSELCTRAVNRLKEICDVEITYEADVIDMPPNVRLGDIVKIADSEGGQYIRARIASESTGAADGLHEITLSNYVAE